MPRRFIAHTCFLSVVLSAAVLVQAKQPKADSDAAISKTLQAMEQAWLNAEKNQDAAAFEQSVADDWVAMSLTARVRPRPRELLRSRPPT